MAMLYEYTDSLLLFYNIKMADSKHKKITKLDSIQYRNNFRDNRWLIILFKCDMNIIKKI